MLRAMDEQAGTHPGVLIEREQLDLLLGSVRARGYTIVGPVARDGAIVYDELESAADLPEGWTDEQEAGLYRLKRREDRALFGYNAGPHSWKKYLFPPVLRLWTARRNGRRIEFAAGGDEPPRYAFLGVRACDIAAMRVQDLTFAEGEYKDPVYRERRASALVIAVQCGKAGGTCFCVSMGTGPGVRDGYDIVLTELLDGGRHAFLATAGSERGAEILGDVRAPDATAADHQAAEAVVQATASQMGRTLETRGIRDLLVSNPHHPRWSDAAARCLTCGNCTLACPTCFCSTTEDKGDLGTHNVERLRRWDSCFMLDHSYMHGGSVRATPLARYRQWLTHKLATWHDQYGVSGCVGCGRCITWCPAEIDITAEVAAIQGSPAAARESPQGRRSGDGDA
jgi:ferredoxin